MELSKLLVNLQMGDTLYLNFGISSTEFGSIHEGILLYRGNESIFGKHVVYNYGVSLTKNGVIKIDPRSKSISLETDSILKFYEINNADYFVKKKEWKLEDRQIEYLKIYFTELENFKEPEGFSNVPDFYAVICGEESFVVIDKVGKWDKFLEVKKILKL